jgi:DNA repair ATPase RecN
METKNCALLYHSFYLKKQNVENLQLMQIQWQQQMMGHAYVQNTEMLNCKRMIQYIIDRFKKLHLNEENAQKLLQEAENLLNSNDIQNSSNKIQVIASDRVHH